MGYPIPVQVCPSALRGIGSQVAETADDLRRTSSGRRDGLPVVGQEAWITAVAARRASTGWSAFLDRLAGEVDGFAGDLRTAAASYEQSDQAAANRLGGAR